VSRRRGIARSRRAAGLTPRLAARLAPGLAARLAPGLAAGLALGLALAGTAAADTPITGRPSWQLKFADQYLKPVQGHSQYLVVIAEPRDSWFFGGSNLAGRGVPEVVRRTGGKWQFPALPPGLRSWIAAASAQSPRDIWAVTYLGGAVLHWNGSTWSTEPRGNWAAGTQFTGINAVGAKSVWLFGAGGRTFPGAGTWHWNGSGWTRARGIAGAVRRASALSPTDIWAIGGIGGSLNALLQLRGTTWRHVSPAALAGFRYSDVVALGRGNVWVAGSVAGIPKLAHFDGTAWTAATMPGSVPATGICRDGRGGVWVIANSSHGPSVLRERSATGHWTTATVSSSSADEVVACAWLPRSARVWGAGKSMAVQGSAAAIYGFGKVP
jgi:hypothetical protein